MNISHPSEYGILHYEHDSTEDVEHHQTTSSLLSTETTNEFITYHHTAEDESLHNYEDDEDNESVGHEKNVGVSGRHPCLDYETQTDYYLNFQATDNEGKGQMSVTSLRISVLDANDSPPQCESNVYRATLDEGATTFDGSGLVIEARDEDVISEISYR